MSGFRLAMLGYPPDYRRDHGGEIVDTAIELADESRWMWRQSLSLLVGGLRTRSREATNCSTRGVWVSGIRVGLFVWLAVHAALGFASALGVFPVERYMRVGGQLVSIMPLVGIVALMFSTRWWAALAITIPYGISFWVGFPYPSAAHLNLVIHHSLLLGVVWWLALARDGRRAINPILGVLLVVGLVLVFGFGGGERAMPYVRLLTPTLLIVGGAILARIDPRLAAAAVVYVALGLSLVLPAAILGTPYSWGYPEWLPITVLLIAATTMVAITRSGTKRLITA